MSGAGRDTEGLNAGTTGSAGMGDQAKGTAEVHTGLHSGGTGDSYEGLQFAGHDQGTSRSRLGGVTETLRDTAGGLGERARNLAGDVRPRVTRAASATRDRAHRALEQRGFLDRLRDNPLPILGVAFAVGFVMAGRDDDDDYSPSPASRARRELKSALMGGVTAGLAQGARGFLSQANNQGSSFLAELLDGFVGGSQGGGDQGGSQGTTTNRASGGGTSERTTGGSTGGGSRTGGMSAAGTGGGTSGSRPPSHQENF